MNTRIPTTPERTAFARALDEADAEITGTGGNCTAIRWDHDGGYTLVCSEVNECTAPQRLNEESSLGVYTHDGQPTGEEVYGPAGALILYARGFKFFGDKLPRELRALYRYRGYWTTTRDAPQTAQRTIKGGPLDGQVADATRAEHRAENAARVDKAARIIANFQEAINDDVETVIIDILADLRHYCYAKRIDFERAVTTSLGHLTEELEQAR